MCCISFFSYIPITQIEIFYCMKTTQNEIFYLHISTQNEIFCLLFLLLMVLQCFKGIGSCIREYMWCLLSHNSCPNVSHKVLPCISHTWPCIFSVTIRRSGLTTSPQFSRIWQCKNTTFSNIIVQFLQLFPFFIGWIYNFFLIYRLFVYALSVCSGCWRPLLYVVLLPQIYHQTSKKVSTWFFLLIKMHSIQQ